MVVFSLSCVLGSQQFGSSCTKKRVPMADDGRLVGQSHFILGRLCVRQRTGNLYSPRRLDAPACHNLRKGTGPLSRGTVFDNVYMNVWW